MVNEGHKKKLFLPSHIQIMEVNVNMDGSLLFGNRDGIQHQSSVLNLVHETYLVEVFYFFLDGKVLGGIYSSLFLLNWRHLKSTRNLVFDNRKIHSRNISVGPIECIIKLTK